MTDCQTAEIEEMRAINAKLRAKALEMLEEPRFPLVIVVAFIVTVFGVVGQVLEAVYGCA